MLDKHKDMESRNDDTFKRITDGLDRALSASGRDIRVSAMVVGDEVGFPRRVAEEKARPGEPGSFSDAYDVACDLLQADKCKAEKDGEYVWFSAAR